MTLKIVQWNSKEYWAGISLRNKLLKTSAGQPWITKVPKAEKKDMHIAAFINGEVVGTLLLSKRTAAVVQIKQVAIDGVYQGFGVGKKLLGFAEKIAELLNFETVFLTGRSQAWGFYEQLGYQSLGQPYTESQLKFKKFTKGIMKEKTTLKLAITKNITLKEMETNG